MKRILAFILCISLVILTLIPTSFGETVAAPIITGDSAVLINAGTGEVLYDKNKDVKQYPASTTKIMTALLVLENLGLDEKVTASAAAAATEGSSIELVEGERMKVRDMLYCLMLVSANDAAVALAEYTSGSVDKFVEMMNSKAKELGAVNTHFATPHGLPNDEHITTAYDLALIAQEAMKNEDFRKIVGTALYPLQATNIKPVRSISNTNRLLFDTASTAVVNGIPRPIKYDGAIGIKTGFTNAAQNCIVAAANKNGVELIGVVLHSNANDIYGDIISLFDFGFNGYSSIQILKAGDIVTEGKVSKGKHRKVGLTVEEDVFGTVERRDGKELSKKDFTYTVSVRSLTAPFDEGMKAGTLTVYKGSKEAGTYDLVTAEGMEISSITKFVRGDGESGLTGFQILVFIAAAFGIVYLILRGVMRRKSERELARRRARRNRRREQYKESAEMRPGSSNIMTLDEIENFRGMEIETEISQTENDIQKEDNPLL